MICIHNYFTVALVKERLKTIEQQALEVLNRPKAEITRGELDEKTQAVRLSSALKSVQEHYNDPHAKALSAQVKSLAHYHNRLDWIRKKYNEQYEDLTGHFDKAYANGNEARAKYEKMAEARRIAAGGLFSECHKLNGLKQRVDNEAPLREDIAKHIEALRRRSSVRPNTGKLEKRSLLSAKRS